MGPTREFPDLLKFNLSVKDIEEQLRRKRKPPKQRIEPIDVKKAKLELHEDSNEKEENKYMFRFGNGKIHCKVGRSCVINVVP